MGEVLSVGQSQLLPSSSNTNQPQPYKIELEGDDREAVIDRELIFTVMVKSNEGGDQERKGMREGRRDDRDIDEDKEPEVSVDVEVLADNTHREAVVKYKGRTENYQYVVSYTPHVRGRHLIRVLVDKTQVATRELYVHCPPTILAKVKPEQPVNCTVHIPSKITVDQNGGIYVVHISKTSRAPEIARFSKNGTQERPITSKYKSGQASMFEFSNWNPKGIAVDKDRNLYIAHLHSLDKLSPKGELLKSINFEDSKENSTDVAHCIPEGIHFHGDRLYVCNGYSSTVLILDTNLELQRCLKIGRENKYLQEPQDISTDHEGSIYIPDSCSHKVFVYDRDGQYKHAIGSHGKREGQLAKPVSLAIAGEHIYVAEELNQRVSVFRTSGEFVCSFQGSEDEEAMCSQLRYPSGVAVDRDGFLYLCDRWDRVIKF